MELRELTWPAVEDAAPEIAVFPVASTEQHGPHDPVGTDSIIATEMAHEACERTGVLCLPPLEIGLAEHHRNFPGTLHVSGETFRAFVRETIESLATHGIEHVIVVNGHGGNSAALEEVCQTVSRQSPVHAVMWEWMSTRDESVDHAGQYETSLIMHLDGELVDEPTKGDADSWGRYVHGASVAHDTEEFTENGATGDAREASAAEGERLFEESVDELVGLIDWLRE